MTSIAHRCRFSTRSDFLLGHQLFVTYSPHLIVILLNVTFIIIIGSTNVLDSSICYCRCITSWPKFFCIGIHIGFFLFFSPLWLNYHNEVLTCTIAELVESETFSELAFKLLSQPCLSQNTIGIPCQSSYDFCSLINLWSLKFHQYLLFLLCLCG